MPLNLDHFLRAAQNHTTSEIFIAGAAQRTEAHTRGTLGSWIARVFKGTETRNQRVETTHAFMAALSEKISAKTSQIGAISKPEVSEQLNEDLEHIVGALQRMLREQMSGNAALTAHAIRLAVNFVDESLDIADSDRKALDCEFNRNTALANLDQYAQDFYAYKLNEVHLARTGSRLQAKSRRPEGEPNMYPAKLLGQFLNGEQINLSFEAKVDLLTKLKAQIYEVDYNCYPIAHLKRLANGQIEPSNRWTDGLEPGSEEVKAYLNAFQTKHDELMAPMKALEFFLTADIRDQKLDRLLKQKQFLKSNGEILQSPKSTEELLKQFQGGEGLSKEEEEFISTVLNSDEWHELNALNKEQDFRLWRKETPNPSLDLLQMTTDVQSDLWQKIVGKKEGKNDLPSEAEINADPTQTRFEARQDVEILHEKYHRPDIGKAYQPNPWGLYVQQKIIERMDELHDFKKARTGLNEEFELMIQSHGDYEEAIRLKENKTPPQKTPERWKPEREAINRPTLNRVTREYEEEKETHPEQFVRGQNRALHIDPNTNPRRPPSNSPLEWNQAYDVNPNSGRLEAFFADNYIVKSDVVLSNLENQTVIDTDKLNESITNRDEFNLYLSDFILNKTANLPTLWAALPTLSKDGYVARAALIEDQITKKLVSMALGSFAERLDATPAEMDALATKISRKVQRIASHPNDRFALISFEKLIEQVNHEVYKVMNQSFFEGELAKAEKAANTYIEGSEEFSQDQLSALANKRNVDTSKLTPEHKQYFADLLNLRLKDIVIFDNGRYYNDELVESYAGRALRYVASLSEDELDASRARLEQLRQSGLTLLASATGQAIESTNTRPQNFRETLLAHLDFIKSEALAKDLLFGGGDSFGGQESDSLMRIPINYALRSLDPEAREKIYSGIAAKNNPFRSSYLAAAAIQAQPSDPSGDSSGSAAAKELFYFLTYLPVEIALPVGIPDDNIKKMFIDPFSAVSDQVVYADFQTNPANPEILDLAQLDSNQDAQAMFGPLDDYVKARAEVIRRTTQEEIARFRREEEEMRAAQNNPQTN